MTAIRLSEITKLSADDERSAFGALAKASDINRIFLWDCGPSKPVAPTRPKFDAKGKEGDPDYDLAKLEFRDELEDYDHALRKYAQDRKDYQVWWNRWQGPREIQMWSVDASNALDNDGNAVAEKRQDRRRYFLSARNHGYTNLPNGGLPDNLKPGLGHEREQDRQRQTGIDLDTMRKRDPVFGEQRTTGS